MARLTVKKAQNLDETKDYYLRQVDDLAEAARMEHLTPGSGQSMTYEVKWQEAQAGGGPMIEAEAAALDMTVAEAIESITTARQQWQTLGAQIESMRLKAKKQIRSAGSPAEMYSLVKQFKEAVDVV